MLTGIFFLILAIALAIYNGKITAGTIAMLILTIIGMANAMRLKPKISLNHRLKITFNLFFSYLQHHPTI
jgi:hypothetical protein